MQLETVPALTVALYSEIIKGGMLVQTMNGTHGITAITAASQPPHNKVLVTHAISESKFQCIELNGNPSMIAFDCKLILKPDLESAFVGKPNPGSLNEVYFDGASPFVAVHSKGAAPGVWPLNLETGIIEEYHGGQMIGFRKWSICVREGGVLHTLIEFKPSTATLFAKLAD
jgi:hypothetical protein